MKLLVENIQDAEVVEEQNENGEKQYFIRGIFLQGDVKNRNGRVYPTKILDKEVSRYRESFIAPKRAYGELGHPKEACIQMERISHLITELEREGTNYVGRAKILDTHYGNIAKTLLKEGCQLGVSSRGIASLKNEDGSNVVQDDFMLTTAADIVADPSAPDAFVEGVLEGVEFEVDEHGNVHKKFVEQIKNKIHKAKKISREELEYQMLESFDELLKTFSKESNI